jgi:O-antigen ligase
MSVMPSSSDQFRDGRITPLYFGMVMILMIMLSGALPSFFYMFSRDAVWGIWVILLVAIAVLGFQAWLPRLILPAIPLVIWLTFYVLWGTLAATYTIFPSAVRLWFRFACIIASTAIVTSHPRRFALFANATQWVLLVNLLVVALLITYPEYQTHPFFLRVDASLESDRFAGLWGDANMAGLVSLLFIVLSYWAKRWIAWIGRLSGATIVYLTASRTAFWIGMAFAVIYLLFVAEKRSRSRALMAVMAVLLLGVGYVNLWQDSNTSFIKENPNLARVFDLSESKTREQGQESRVDLAKMWLSEAAKEPWFGYGLYSSEGDNSVETMVKRGFPTQGTHNLYLALFIDAGWVGLLYFLALITLQLLKIRRIRLPSGERNVLFALCFVILVFAMTSHQMVTDYTGWMGFSLIFLLPLSPALNHFPSA